MSMKAKVVIPLVVGGVVLFVLGMALGIWFSMNYRVVILPVSEMPEKDVEPLGFPDMEPVGVSEEAVEPVAVSEEAVEPVALPGQPRPGSFSYQFVPNEVLTYRLTAEIGGSGFGQGEDLGIGLSMDAMMNLVTEEVDGQGTGSLRMDFEAARMLGSFMGSPVTLHQSGDDALFSMAGETQVDTSQGQSIEGIPQLEFFKEPIRMVVARNGEVLDVSSVSGLEQVLSPPKLAAPVEFPAPEMDPGQEWISEFRLPVPGFGVPVDAIAHNVMEGYETVGGVRCAVVRQTLSSQQRDGALVSPPSVLGEGMQFSMPTFDLSGENMIYFDVSTGKLVHSFMDLDLSMEIGEELAPVAELVGMYAELLSELDGTSPSRRKPKANERSPMELGVNIKGSISLVN